MATNAGPTVDENVVWAGRPAIAAYAVLYGVLILVLAGILVGLELFIARTVGPISGALYASLKAGPITIPDAVEVATALVLLFAFLAKLVGLALTRASSRYELRTDGLYVNKGIVSLSNTFISAVAFSDARLVRTPGMRVVGLGKIIVEANDGRRFELKMVKDSTNVQNLIRSNLSHPTVRVEGRAP